MRNRLVPSACSRHRIAVASCILSSLILASGIPVAAQATGTFVATGTMTTPRMGHTATLLHDGRVLIAGGDTRKVEIYDPATGRFTAIAPMKESRRMHSATLLPDGKVLIAGGWNLTSAELFDPATLEFSLTGSMLEEQGGHAAVVLPNGKVLIAGGQRSSPPFPTSARAELYDPATGTFSFAGSYASIGTLYPAGGPVWPTSNLLPDGRVLVAGENPPELYDPETDAFSLAGRMNHSVYKYGMIWHAATTLLDGSVLITGGSDDFSCTGMAEAETYDPSTRTFSVAGSMTASRDRHTATLLRNGMVLITGGGDGWCGRHSEDTAELYDPVTRTFTPTGKMTHRRGGHTATRLLDGSVLLVGGDSYWPREVLATAEVYHPAQKRRRTIRP